MTILPHIVVAGLGRCGSSLMMQMLHHGGVPCLGTYPDFECMETMSGKVGDAWLAENAGKAVKILNPHSHPWPAASPRIVIWMARNPKEQAKSQIKFVASFRDDIETGRNARRAAERSIIKDSINALRMIQLSGSPLLKMTFEDLIIDPVNAAYRVATFVQTYRPDLRLNKGRMIDVVLPRGPACRPDMSIEALQIQTMEEHARRYNQAPG